MVTALLPTVTRCLTYNIWYVYIALFTFFLFIFALLWLRFHKLVIISWTWLPLHCDGRCIQLTICTTFYIFLLDFIWEMLLLWNVSAHTSAKITSEWATSNKKGYDLKVFFYHLFVHFYYFLHWYQCVPSGCNSRCNRYWRGASKPILILFNLPVMARCSTWPKSYLMSE